MIGSGFVAAVVLCSKRGDFISNQLGKKPRNRKNKQLQFYGSYQLMMTSSTSDNNDALVYSKTKTIKAVIFDMDGTLLDTEALSCRAVIESFAIIGLSIPQSFLDNLKQGGWLLPWELKRRILGLRGSGMY